MCAPVCSLAAHNGCLCSALTGEYEEDFEESAADSGVAERLEATDSGDSPLAVFASTDFEPEETATASDSEIEEDVVRLSFTMDDVALLRESLGRSSELQRVLHEIREDSTSLRPPPVSPVPEIDEEIEAAGTRDSSPEEDTTATNQTSFVLEFAHASPRNAGRGRRHNIPLPHRPSPPGLPVDHPAVKDDSTNFSPVDLAEQLASLPVAHQLSLFKDLRSLERAAADNYRPDACKAGALPAPSL